MWCPADDAHAHAVRSLLMTSATQAEGELPAASQPEQMIRSLSQGLAGNRNSLGIIRLVLASAVIFSHAFYIGGWGHDPFLDLVRNQESIGGVAVFGFFAISGYLITKSGMGADALQFIWRRALRIFPAFWTVLIVAAFVIGPITWATMGRSLASYFTLGAGGPFAYVYRNIDLTIRQYGVLDVFVDTPYGATAGAVFNGSLWTLGYEWGAYLIVFALVVFGVLQRARILVPILTAFYFIVEVSHQVVPFSAGQIFPYFADHYRVSLPLIFLYGACLAVYSRKVVLDWRLGVLAAGLVGGSLLYGGFSILGYPALAYLVMWLATALPSRVQWIGAKNDYSYGMYVYGFLIQQLTAYLGWYHWGYWPWTLAVLMLTAGCAWLSWHGIEKRALALKDRGPGRGIEYWLSRIGRLFRQPTPKVVQNSRDKKR
jgi:peptidoglycan/LPS O-acetylase OafA/YrhL